MTLSALSKDGVLLTPSLMPNISQSKITDLRKQSRDGRLFCPHCYQKLGKMFEVHYRHSTVKRPHFFHPKYEGEERECKNHSSESEKHLSAKRAIADELQSLHGLADIKLELRVELLDPGLTFRKPDILVTHINSVMEAHEVQISRIDSVELERRTQGLKQHGCGSVVWYLYGGNYNDENRSYLQKAGIKCFHLWFEDGDDAKPKWKESEPTQKRTAEAAKGMASDQCTVKSPKTKTKALKVGDRVTNSKGWHGEIKRIEPDESPHATDGKYYWVWWQEREHHAEAVVRRNPICGHLRSQIEIAA